MSSTYIDVPIITDPDTLAADTFAFIQALIPSYVPNAGNLDTILVEAIAAMAAEVATVASSVPASIFRFFGQLVGVQPINPTPASVPATITAVDTAGYTVPAGTIIGLQTPGGSTVPFALALDVSIPVGETESVQTATFTAVTAGAAGSGLGGNGVAAQIITTLSFVSAVTLLDQTTGGLDGESDSSYLSRLASELVLLAPRPILPGDFAALARNIAGVGRALAVDGLSPAVNEVQTITVNATGGTFTVSFGGHTTAAIARNASAATVQSALEALASIGTDGVNVTGGPLATAPVTVTFVGANGGINQANMTTTATSLTGGSSTATVAGVTNGAAATTGNERMIGVALLDSQGNAASSGVKSAVSTYLDSQREVNFVVNVFDPSYTEIDVSYTVAVVEGFDPDATVAACTAALTSFLSQISWGVPPGGTPTSWVNTTAVRLLDLASVLKNVQGVAYITALTFAPHGDSLATTDVDLPGDAPIAVAGTITGAHT